MSPVSKITWEIHIIISISQEFKPTSRTPIGPQLVKAALALALFGGRQKHTGKNSVPVRGDPHILMVGDPGLGKSQMLQVTHRIHTNCSFISAFSG